MRETSKYPDRGVNCRVGRFSSETGAMHPALPAVVLLVSFAVFMAAIAPLNFSGVLAKIFPFHPVELQSPNAVVWVSQTAGTYFCADSVMFGKADGKLMKQAEALDNGYQPALGTYCKGPDWPLPREYRKPDHSALPANPLTVPPTRLMTPGMRKPYPAKPANPKPNLVPPAIPN
ncbi:MAG TPA: hypothetical protein VGS20_11915 [Candidatus Acidoferrales bacterium]|nr:hypothetical protein [Candidatus Acidoferrales bacterium]